MSTTKRCKIFSWGICIWAKVKRVEGSFSTLRTHFLKKSMQKIEGSFIVVSQKKNIIHHSENNLETSRSKSLLCKIHVFITSNFNISNSNSFIVRRLIRFLKLIISIAIECFSFLRDFEPEVSKFFSEWWIIFFFLEKILVWILLFAHTYHVTFLSFADTIFLF